MLQLQANEEVATVTAGPDAQAAAAHTLQQAREALALVERVRQQRRMC
jgi:NADPH-dependent glutamate synthase beta subunit-like oxidoreductase